MASHCASCSGHFPQHSIHPHAGVAAQAAEAAAIQDKFWEMHEALFRNQQQLGEVDFDHLALKLGLELYRFTADLGSDRVIERVQRQRAGGVRKKVRRTPTFFINGHHYDGPADFPSLSDAIERAMNMQ